jgi:S-layer family protein
MQVSLKCLRGIALVFLLPAVWNLAYAADVPAGPIPPGTETPSHISQRCLNPGFSISPNVGAAGTPVTIRGGGSGCPFPPIQVFRPGKQCLITADSTCAGNIAAVTFGSTTVLATNQSDGTILAIAPAPGPNDASVPVALTLNDGTIIGGGSTVFSFPVAEMDMTGPLPMNPSPVGETDTQWSNGANHVLQTQTPIGPPTNVLTFGIAAPVFHVSIAYVDSGNTEIANDTTTQVIGNVGDYSATLQVCAIDATAAQAQAQRPNTLAPSTFGNLSSPEAPYAPCLNWDNNSGYWINVVNQQAVLNDPKVDARGNPLTARGDIALPAASAFHPATYDFAHTFRIVLSLAEIDTTRDTMANRNDAYYGPAFTAVLLPTAMVQLKVLPFNILFSPPGNLSKVSFQTTAAYNTSYSLGSSNEASNAYAEDVSSSTQYSAKISGASTGGNKEGGSTSASTQYNYDTTTTSAYGTLTGNTGMGMSTQQAQVQQTLSGNAATTPGSGQTCASATDCSPQHLVTAPNWFMNQPFWDDTFQLLVHPQFAAFDIGNSQDRFVYWGADYVLASVQVWQLWECATDQLLSGTDPCQITYAYSWLNAQQQNASVNGTLSLTAQEAINLLSLDPFYMAGTQNAPLSTVRAVPFPGPQVSFGARFAPCPSGQSCTPATPVSITSSLTNTQVSASGTNGKQTYTDTVTNVLGNSNTIGQTLTMASQYVSVELGLTVTNGDKTTTTTQSQAIFNNSTAVSTTLATQAMVTLADCDSSSQGSCVKSPHAPLPQLPEALIYLDKIYGGFMFVDPNAPLPMTPDAFAGFVSALSVVDRFVMATNGEQSLPRFPDVAGNPQQGIIGMLARIGILPGRADGKFYPQSTFSRADLAVALTSYLHFSGGAPATTYSDVSAQAAYAPAVAAAVKVGLVVPSSATRFGAQDAVSRVEMATSLAKAFGLANDATSNATPKRAKVPARGIADESSIAPAAVDNVRAVIGAGYMTIFADQTFRPAAPVTRADAAQSLYAAIKDNLK